MLYTRNRYLKQVFLDCKLSHNQNLTKSFRSFNIKGSFILHTLQNYTCNKIYVNDIRYNFSYQKRDLTLLYNALNLHALTYLRCILHECSDSNRNNMHGSRNFPRALKWRGAGVILFPREGIRVQDLFLRVFSY